MEFPIYAKHTDESVWYEILSAHHFKEKKRLGPSKRPRADVFLHTEIRAEDYSSALYIQDLLEALKNGLLIETTASEYHSIGD